MKCPYCRSEGNGCGFCEVEGWEKDVEAMEEASTPDLKEEFKEQDDLFFKLTLGILGYDPFKRRDRKS